MNRQREMQNNWVLLRGRLCHKPNYTSTQRGLHKVAFRLAIPRPIRVPGSATPPPPVAEADISNDPPLPAPGTESDYVTVIIIGRPAYDFQQLNLEAGAAVQVKGRLRSWDQPRSESIDERVADASRDEDAKRSVRRDYRIEVIAEKVEPIE